MSLIPRNFSPTSPHELTISFSVSFLHCIHCKYVPNTHGCHLWKGGDQWLTHVRNPSPVPRADTYQELNKYLTLMNLQDVTGTCFLICNFHLSLYRYVYILSLSFYTHTHMRWGERIRTLIKMSAFGICELYKLSQVISPLYSLICKMGNNNVSVPRVTEVNELILGKFVEPSLAHSKHLVSVSYPHI